MNWRLWIPLFAFAAFLGLAAYQLTQPKDEFVESRMVGESLPYFELPPAMAGVDGIGSADFADGEPRLYGEVAGVSSMASHSQHAV